MQATIVGVTHAADSLKVDVVVSAPDFPDRRLTLDATGKTFDQVQDAIKADMTELAADMTKWDANAATAIALRRQIGQPMA